METALSVISQLPATREQLKTFTRLLKDEILSNNSDPLKELVKLKFAEKAIKSILEDEDLDYHFLKEFDLFSSKEEVIVLGAQLRQSEVGVKYDYSSSGDPVWNDIEKGMLSLSERKKEREKFLQSLPYEGTVDPTTGVYITKPVKTSKTKVIVKL